MRRGCSSPHLSLRRIKSSFSLRIGRSGNPFLCSSSSSYSFPTSSSSSSSTSSFSTAAASTPSHIKFLDQLLQPSYASQIALIDPIIQRSFTYSDLDFYSNLLVKELLEEEEIANKAAAATAIAANANTTATNSSSSSSSTAATRKKMTFGAFNYSPGTFTISLIATWKIGKVFVPLSISHSISELSYFLQDANIATIFTFNQQDLMKEKFDALPSQIIELEKLLKQKPPPLPSSTSNTTLSHTTTTPTPKSDALILYTSGTTGKPKGVVHTHDSIEHMMKSLIEAWKYTANDKILHFLPLYHMHGLMNKLLTMLYVGGTIEFLSSAKAGILWKRLAQEAILLQKNKNSSSPAPSAAPSTPPTSLAAVIKPVTLFMAVPTVYAKMIEYSKTMDSVEKTAAIQTMQSLRLMVCGSAALPDIIMDEWYKMTGQVLLERYGMTELGMVLSNPYENQERRKGSVGFPMPYVTVRLIDENGQEIHSANTPGELQVQGKTVFKRYLNKPEATRDAFDGNWFKTGDISEVSGDGYYKILGRNSTDIIKVPHFLSYLLSLVSFPSHFPPFQTPSFVLFLLSFHSFLSCFPAPSPLLSFRVRVIKFLL